MRSNVEIKSIKYTALFAISQINGPHVCTSIQAHPGEKKGTIIFFKLDTQALISYLICKYIIKRNCIILFELLRIKSVKFFSLFYT